MWWRADGHMVIWSQFHGCSHWTVKTTTTVLSIVSDVQIQDQWIVEINKYKPPYITEFKFKSPFYINGVKFK